MIEKPWLIQRVAVKRHPPTNAKSFDDYLSCDYMGSAEFEFGALPKSLKRVCKNIDNYRIINTKIKDFIKRDLFMFVKKGDEDYIKYIDYITEDEYKVGLKERTNIKDFITGSSFSRQLSEDNYNFGYNIWWDIINDVFFTFGKQKINLVIKAIKGTKEKKQSQNEEGWF